MFVSSLINVCTLQPFRPRALHGITLYGANIQTPLFFYVQSCPRLCLGVFFCDLLLYHHAFALSLLSLKLFKYIHFSETLSCDLWPLITKILVIVYQNFGHCLPKFWPLLITKFLVLCFTNFLAIVVTKILAIVYQNFGYCSPKFWPLILQSPEHCLPKFWLLTKILAIVYQNFGC